MDMFTNRQYKILTAILSDELRHRIIESNHIRGDVPTTQQTVVDNLVKFVDLLKETNEEKIRRSVVCNPEFQTAKFFLETCKNTNVTRNNRYLLRCIVSCVNMTEISIDEIYDLIIDNFTKKKYFIIEICLDKWVNSFLPEQLYYFLKKLERLINMDELEGIDGTYIKKCCGLIISSDKIAPNYKDGMLLKHSIELELNTCLAQLLLRPLTRLNQISYACTDKRILCDIRYGELKIAFHCDNITAGKLLMKKILAENPKMPIEQMMPYPSKGQSTQLTNPIHWEEYQKSFKRFLVMCQNA